MQCESHLNAPSHLMKLEAWKHKIMNTAENLFDKASFSAKKFLHNKVENEENFGCRAKFHPPKSNQRRFFLRKRATIPRQCHQLTGLTEREGGREPEGKHS